MKKIARVFPTRTKMSPVDEDSYFGQPGLFVSQGYKEIHISVSFTWDIEKVKWLKDQWEMIAPVKIGGPAIDGEGGEFTPGMYLKKGATITSRGCPNRCPWCFVRKPLRELKIKPGNDILDNNLLACSKSHIDKVFSMLKGQREIKLSGGLEASRINGKIVEQLRGLRIKRLFLAYDQEGSFRSVEKAFRILKKYFSRNCLGCYVLIGYKEDTLDEAEGRLRQILDLGGFPFAMLYRGIEGGYPEPKIAWKFLQRHWIHPGWMRHKINKKED